MYTKDKSTRITLRLNDRQFAFVKASADMMGVSPSEFLRIVVNSAMSTVKLPEMVKLEEEGDGRENDKADKHDKL